MSTRRRGQAYALLAMLAWSTGGVLQRQLSLGVVAQVGGRAVFGGLTLLAWLLLNARSGRAVVRSLLRTDWKMATCVAAAQLSFIVALNHTTVAVVLLFQAISPLLAALLAVIFLDERSSARTWSAMLVALGGVALMVGGGPSPTVLGEGAAAAMAVLFAVMIVLARRSGETSVLPAVCVAQGILVGIALLALVADPAAMLGGAGPGALPWLVLLGVFQVGVGFAAFSIGARLLPVAEMALITLIEVVLGPLWSWLFVAEAVGVATVVGGAVALAAVAYQALSPSGRPGARLTRRGPGPPTRSGRRSFPGIRPPR